MESRSTGISSTLARRQSHFGANVNVMTPSTKVTSVKEALQTTEAIPQLKVQGWIRTRRDSKDFSFIELNDGSSLPNLQVIARNTLPNYPAVQKLTTGASIIVHGELVPSQGKGQKWEVV